MTFKVFIHFCLILILCTSCAHSASKPSTASSHPEGGCYNKSNGTGYLIAIALIFALGPPTSFAANPCPARGMFY